MSIHRVNERDLSSLPSPCITIQQIEVFKIAALAVEVDGYRVCMRLRSNRGLAWSEIFVEKHDIPLLLEQWKLALATFIGHFQYTQLSKLLTQAKEQHTVDKRALYLYTTALHQLKFMPEPKKRNASPEEEVLKNRALAYFSLI